MPLKSFRRDGDLRSRMKQFVKPYFRVEKNRNLEPLNAWVFIAHYKFTVGILLCLFVSLVGCWFASSPMECILKYDRSNIEEYQEELCLSYPYTYNSERDRVYALHYRWVHWAVLGLIPLYCIPLHLKKHFEIESINHCLYYISTADKKDPKRANCISTLIDGLIGFCTGDLYFEKLQILFVTFLVDIVAFAFIDISLQNRFARLFPLDYPFTRWPQFFNDTLSLAFPPFVECKIGKEMMLMDEMEETIGCSLNLMKVYDKIFVIMWVWMTGLSAWTLFTIIYYIMLRLSRYHQRKLIKRKDCASDSEVCIRVLNVGDLLLLNCLASILNSDENQEVLKKIANKIKLCNKSKVVLD